MAHQIGEKFGGGIIFHIDETGEHGLIAAPSDQGSFAWNDAVAACSTLDLGSYKDWRLPSKAELNMMYERRTVIGGFSSELYWSSTEGDFFKDVAWNQHFANGVVHLRHHSRVNAPLLVRDGLLVLFHP